jgi:hypothetical protein
MAFAENELSLELSLPAGDYQFQWLDPKKGVVLCSNSLGHTGARRLLNIPAFEEDIALVVRKR